MNKHLTFYFVRHGRTLWNEQGLLQGFGNSDLTEQGVKRAKQTSEALRHIPFVATYSSCLQRTIDTAQHILGERDVPLFQHKGLLHTKSMLIDNKLALVGTVNMDMRSFLLNFEVTMVVEDAAFANEISLLHESYIKNAELLNYVEWANRSVYQRIIEKLFFLFSPLL